MVRYSSSVTLNMKHSTVNTFRSPENQWETNDSPEEF